MSGILALDWGLRKVGVATSDANGTVITPRKTFMRPQAGQIWSFSGDDKTQLTKLIEDYEPALIILGSPVAQDGAATESSKGSERLATKISEHTGLSVKLVPEFLTSWEARSRGAKDEDSEAAAILIRDYFSAQTKGT